MRWVKSRVNHFLLLRDALIQKSSFLMHKCRPVSFVNCLLNFWRERVFISNYLCIWVMKYRIGFALECLILFNIIINRLSKRDIGALYMIVTMEYWLWRICKNVKRSMRRIFSTSLSWWIRLFVRLKNELKVINYKKARIRFLNKYWRYLKLKFDGGFLWGI